MSSFFQNKVAWVTGASSGLGEAIALELAKHHAQLILTARREDELQRVKNNCAKFIPAENILVLPADLSHLSDPLSLTNKVIEKFGRIDILVNNAGISQRSRALDTVIEVERNIMELNYFSKIMLSKAVLPFMQKQKSGSIVIMSSLMGKLGFRRRSSYCASKHALHGYFESLRQEVYADNIHINIICPGYVKTNVSLNAVTATGAKHNQMDEGQANGMDPIVCAKNTLRAIEHNRHEVFMGGRELAAVTIRRLFPNLFYKLILKVKQPS